MAVTNVAKNSSTITMQSRVLVEDFLLKEDGFYLLLETGDKIILDQTSLHPVIPTNSSKSTITTGMITKSAP